MSTRARTRAAAAAAAAAAAEAASSTSTPQTSAPPPPAPAPAPPTPAPKPKSKPKPQSTRKTTAATPTPIKHEQQLHNIDTSEKENIKTTTTTTAAAAAAPAPPTKPAATKKTKPKAMATAATTKAAQYCTCSRGDDGSPMIHCSECHKWYHFICVDLAEPDAEEIEVYICPSCTQSTGRKTAMVWEGPEALEDGASEAEPVVPKISKPKKPPVTVSTKPKAAPAPLPLPPPPPPPPQSPSEESEGDGSGDEYVAEEEGAKSKGKRRLRHSPSSGSESGSSGDESSPQSTINKRKKTKARRISRSRTPTSPIVASAGKSRLKRKPSISEAQPPTKRKRSDTATEDPVRTYCRGKLEEVFKEVFFRYPHVRHTEQIEGGGEGGDGGPREVQSVEPKKLEEMTEEEKEALMNECKQFSAELEQCIFDIYSEPDKNGISHAGGKYKDRFRMLQFNLSKPDRVVIHQRITTGTITPREISLMSSTDLADEETKQHIKIAEKESLEQTILQKPLVPRAKITHKGLQDIEDVNGEIARARETERQRDQEQEEEERRERERKERFKAVERQRQRTQSLSVPPESPVVPSHSPTSGTAGWGAPPPVPAHVLQQQQQQEDILSPSIRPLFAHTISEVTMAAPEPELNLADLINIDEDGAEQEGASVNTGTSTGGEPNMDTSAPAAQPLDQPIEPDGGATDKPPGVHHQHHHHHPVVGLSPISVSPATSPTTPSPFSATRPRGLSFDLNSLWSGPKDDDISRSPEALPPAAPDADASQDISAGSGAGEPSGDDKLKGLMMEPEPMEVTNDDDFDMFLEEKDEVVHRAEAGGSAVAGPVVEQDPEAIFEATPHCWTGKIHMPLDSAAPQSTTVFAQQIGGRSLSQQSPWWKTLFPSEDLRIDGRVPTKSSSEFLTQVRLNPTKELIAVAFSPVAENLKIDFDALTGYLKSRDRHGLVFPWGQRHKDWAPGRELYLIPLLASEALPEYIELLDELKIPKTRKGDFMIGIWVLTRGKLDHPPPQPPATASASGPPSAPKSSSTTPSAPPTNIPMFPPPHASSSHSPPGPPLPTASLPGANTLQSQPLPQPQIDQAALAAEVASLTPEQVQNLLRTLTTNTSLPLNIPTSSGAPPVAPQLSSLLAAHPHGALPLPPPPNPPPHQPHQWPGFPAPSGLPPPPPGGYPPLSAYVQPPHPIHPPPQHPGPNDHDRRDSYPPPHGGRGGDRDRERGGPWRGGVGGRDSRHRGGPRGKHRGGGNASHRPVDSGWPRKQRNDDGGGSPNRRW